MTWRWTYLVVKASFFDLGDENVVGLTGDIHALFGAVAENTDGDAGTREGVTVHKRLVDSELTTNCLDEN